MIMNNLAHGNRKKAQQQRTLYLLNCTCCCSNNKVLLATTKHLAQQANYYSSFPARPCKRKSKEQSTESRTF